MRTIKARIDIDLVLMHEKWRLQRRRSVPLFSLTMINFVVINGQELAITQLLKQGQLLFHLFIHIRKIGIVIIPFYLQIR